MGSFWKGGEYVDPTSQNLAPISRRALLRHTSKVGAVCGNAARTDLRGGRREIVVPAATASGEDPLADSPAG
jgi:hypothetical protein